MGVHFWHFQRERGDSLRTAANDTRFPFRCVGLISRILRCILHIQITTHYKIFFRLTHLQTLRGQDVCCLTRSLGKRGLHADTIWTGQRRNNWEPRYIEKVGRGGLRDSHWQPLLSTCHGTWLRKHNLIFNNKSNVFRVLKLLRNNSLQYRIKVRKIQKFTYSKSRKLVSWHHKSL